MDMEYVIKIICIEPDGQSKYHVGMEFEFYVSYDEDDSLTAVAAKIGLQNAQIFDETIASEGEFESFINKIHHDLEKYINSFNLTIDRFELCEVSLKEIASVVV